MTPRLDLFAGAAPAGLLAARCLEAEAQQPRIRVVRHGVLERGPDGRMWRWDSDRPVWLPQREPLIERRAAISVVSGPTPRTSEGQNNSFSVDATGGDYLLAFAFAANSSFAGVAPSTRTYAGSTMTSLVASTGGDLGPGNQLYGVRAPATGSNTMVINYSTSSFAIGPKIAWCVLSGVEQGSSATDALRDSGHDDTLGSSISFTLTTQTGDFCVIMVTDYQDTTHTITGEQFESTTNQGTLGWGQVTATGTSTTLSATGGTNSAGLAAALIPAADTGGGGGAAGPLVNGGLLKDLVNGGLVH